MPFSTWHDPKDFPFGERDHHVIHKIEIIRECMRIRDADMFNKSSEKHSTWKSHIGAPGHTNHSIDDVVGKIEMLSSGKTVEHVAKTSIRMVLVSREAYGIFTEDDFPFFKIGNDHGRSRSLLAVSLEGNKETMKRKERTDVFVYQIVGSVGQTEPASQAEGTGRVGN
nr:hypothetical protein [Tanacetum cinerariifolium]